VGEIGNDFYVVMELIEGRLLSDLITATGLSMEILTRYGTQIADALAHAHDRGIVHRDLKGSNVMITPEGRVKVLDFGLATRLDRDEISELTRSYTSVERGHRNSICISKWRLIKNPAVGSRTVPCYLAEAWRASLRPKKS
jgi:serine/threonine protein kinase